MTLDSVYDRNANALNAVRLLLTTSVIIWHSFPLTGIDIGFAPLRQLVGEVGVDGFFAVSGFLIVASWMNNPSWWHYSAARVLRIFPGFWVCLVVTAFVLAPIGVLIANGGSYGAAVSMQNLTYVTNNALLDIQQYDIAGTPKGVPFEAAWNGALWTLRWEFYCYIAVLVLGLMRLLHRRATLPILFVLALVGLIATTVGGVNHENLADGSRFGIMFAAGALVGRLSKRLPASWTYVGIAAAVVLASMFLPDYRIVAALPLAYVLITGAALLKSPRLRLENDYSYGMYVYGFPVQQVLAIVGIPSIFGVTGVAGAAIFAVFALVCTLPIAAASWFLIERNALRLKPKRNRAPLSPRQTISSLA